MKPISKPPVKASEGIVKKNTLAEIQKLQKDRDERRKNMEQIKLERIAEEQRNRENGTPGDVDFQRMIRQYREQASQERTHLSTNDKICICVRKRPLSVKEVKRLDYDSVTCINPVIAVHDCKLKVDGISKYLDNNLFEMDHAFHEDNTTEDIYYAAIEPLVDFVLDSGRATVFAYGQTGSGKTYTMQGIQSLISEDLLKLLGEQKLPIQVYVSFFEIYGGRCQDLLNDRQRLNVREDGTGEVIVSDLLESEAHNAEVLRDIINTGNRNRTTHATESNDESSRSHAICQISLKNINTNREIGRLSLIDLAGSERGADTKSHNRQRRMEGAEINKSLLALKECIRALDSNNGHVPYRGSKLTLVLKDSFTRQKSRTVMIATVSPVASCADHTINTLRYADRIKERIVSQPSISSPQPSGPSQISVKSSQPSSNPPSSRVSPVPQTSARSGGNGSQLSPGRGQNIIRNSPVPIAIRGGGNNNGIQKSSGVDSRPPSSRKEMESKITSQPVNNQLNIKTESVTNINQSDSKTKMKVYNEEKNQFKKDYEKENDRLNAPDSDDYAYLDDTSNDDFAKTMEEEFQNTVQSLFEEEEELLNMHMNIIQENAELLTEEGRLLQQMQTDDYDIDSYTEKLDKILNRKQELIGMLRDKLSGFRKQLVKEETISRKVRGF